MGVLTRWASSPETAERSKTVNFTESIKAEMKEPEIILKVVEGDKIIFKVRVKRKTLIEKIKKSDSITTEFINYFEAEEVSIEKDDILKIMKWGGE